MQHNLLNTALEYVSRQLSVPLKSRIYYKSVTTTNRMCRGHKYQGKDEKSFFWDIRRTKKRAKEAGANINVRKKTKAMAENRKTR